MSRLPGQFLSIDQGSWDQFTWTEPILLGNVVAGDHSIIFSTDGQQYGVADLDALFFCRAQIEWKRSQRQKVITR